MDDDVLTKAQVALVEILTPPPQPITQQELEGFRDAEQVLTKASREYRAAKANMDAIREDLVGRLKAGVPVLGNLVATVIQEPQDCRPAWKEEFLTHMQEVHGVQKAAAEEAVRSNNPPGTREVLAIGYRT